MIVWGGAGIGIGYLNTGGRYSPSTDTWAATSTTNAPDSRYGHTAVWTGSEMIAWGGIDSGNNYLNSGGRYNPSSDSWTATNTTKRARSPCESQGSLDAQRNDRLGRRGSAIEAEHGQEILCFPSWTDPHAAAAIEAEHGREILCFPS